MTDELSDGQLMGSEHPFDRLTPDFILDAIESLGLICDGRIMALNSYENRVYQVGIDEQAPVIAKFYRPERWSRQQIEEEHRFCAELFAQELPVVPPWCNEAGQSLFEYQGFFIAVYERKGGHAPELSNLDDLYTLGRTLARMHNVGELRAFEHRPAITLQNFAFDSVALLSDRFVPDDLKTAFDSLCADMLPVLQRGFESVTGVKQLRVHGDCHIGNILWRDQAPHFVDFDDARMAPAIQDLWMLLSGDRHQQQLALQEIVEAYEEFRDFDRRELRLIEPLRTMRILNYNAWIANRWHDPAFPKAFPWFNTPRYWSDLILQLREQYAALQEPALELMN